MPSRNLNQSVRNNSGILSGIFYIFLRTLQLGEKATWLMYFLPLRQSSKSLVYNMKCLLSLSILTSILDLCIFYLSFTNGSKDALVFSVASVALEISSLKRFRDHCKRNFFISGKIFSTTIH